MIALRCSVTQAGYTRSCLPSARIQGQIPSFRSEPGTHRPPRGAVLCARPRPRPRRHRRHHPCRPLERGQSRPRAARESGARARGRARWAGRPRGDHAVRSDGACATVRLCNLARGSSWADPRALRRATALPHPSRRLRSSVRCTRPATARCGAGVSTRPAGGERAWTRSSARRTGCSVYLVAARCRGCRWRSVGAKKEGTSTQTCADRSS